MTMHVYDFEEGEAFIAARTMEEAKTEYAELYSVDGGDLCKELTEEDLDNTTVVMLDEDDLPTDEIVTMRAHLTEQLTMEGEDEAAFYLCGRE
jgi:hypothetical protein